MDFSSRSSHRDRSTVDAGGAGITPHYRHSACWAGNCLEKVVGAELLCAVLELCHGSTQMLPKAGHWVHWDV